MLRLMALLLLLIPAGCKSTPLTPEEEYIRAIQREREDEERAARKAVKKAKYQEKVETWHRDDQSSRAAWREVTGGQVEFGNHEPFPEKNCR